MFKMILIKDPLVWNIMYNGLCSIEEDGLQAKCTIIAQHANRTLRNQFVAVLTRTHTAIGTVLLEGNVISINDATDEMIDHRGCSPMEMESFS